MTPLAQVAAKDLGDSIRNYQTGSSSEFVIFAVIFLVALSLALAGWWLLHYRKEQRRPLLLFFDLAEYHQLARADQKQLIQFARAHNVEDPACLFVCPQLVERIKSLETCEAGSEKESQRLEDFFGRFSRAVFGDLGTAETPAGGEE